MSSGTDQSAGRGADVGGPAATPTDLRVDALTRVPSVIVAARQDRPNRPTVGCPFCPGGVEAPDPYDVRWFVNRWPPLPDARAEVVLYTPQHDAEFWTLGADGARRVVDLWAARTLALGSRPDVDYVLVFENRGQQAGATIPHPHGQVYGFEQVPPNPLRELLDGVLEPTAIDEALVVSRSGEWSAWVPEAAVYPYELRLASTSDAGALTDASCDRDGLAAVLVDSLARLDQLFDEPMPYMMWIHQRPTDGRDWPSARVHVHLTPLLRAPGTLRFVAAAEVGAGVFFDPVDPLDAAERLRACAGAS